MADNVKAFFYLMSRDQASDIIKLDVIFRQPLAFSSM